MRANVYNSIYNPASASTWGIPLFACGTGNCTWEASVNLEARAVCHDLTANLSVTCLDFSKDMPSSGQNCTIGIPGGLNTSYLQDSGGMYGGYPMRLGSIDNGTSTNGRPSLRVYQWISALGLDPDLGGQILANISDPTKWIASECSLELCVRASRASVESTVFSEETLKYYPAIGTSEHISDPDVYSGVNMMPSWLSEYGRSSPEAFGIRYEPMTGLWSFLEGIDGMVYAISDVLEFYGNEDIMQALLVQNFTMCETPDDKLTCAVANMAKALSKTFRDASYVAAQQSDSNASLTNNASIEGVFSGQAFGSANFVSVHWYWISLPVLVWVLAASTCISPAVVTRWAGVPWWNNNPLPLLFLYRGTRKLQEQYEEQERPTVGSKDTNISVATFMTRARAIHARLVVRDNEAELV